MLTTLISALALLVAMAGLGAAHYWSHLEHKRQRQHATVDFWLQLADRRRELGDGLRYLGPLGSRAEAVAEHLDDPATTQKIVRLLSDLEFIATAVNVGAMDAAVLRRMSFSYLTKVSSDLRPYIEHRRLTQPTAFCELESMLQTMREQSS